MSQTVRKNGLMAGAASIVLASVPAFAQDTGIEEITVTATKMGATNLQETPIAMSAFGTGLLLLLASRLFDGLDGAVARLTRPTDRGAFLDITLDFLFYASVPLAFAFANPGDNALPAALLLAAFIGTGSSVLAFSALAGQRGLQSTAYPNKGLYYLGGLTEATETLICFALMCLFPAQFALWACGFAALCGLTIVSRLWAGWRILK